MASRHIAWIAVLICLNVMLLSSAAVMGLSVSLIALYKSTSTFCSVLIITSASCTIFYTAIHCFISRRLFNSAQEKRSNTWAHRYRMVALRLLVVLLTITLGIDLSLNKSVWEDTGGSIILERFRAGTILVTVTATFIVWALLETVDQAFSVGLFHIPNTDTLLLEPYSAKFTTYPHHNSVIISEFSPSSSRNSATVPSSYYNPYSYGLGIYKSPASTAISPSLPAIPSFSSLQLPFIPEPALRPQMIERSDKPRSPAASHNDRRNVNFSRKIYCKGMTMPGIDVERHMPNTMKNGVASDEANVALPLFETAGGRHMQIIMPRRWGDRPYAQSFSDETGQAINSCDDVKIDSGSRHLKVPLVASQRRSRSLGADEEWYREFSRTIQQSSSAYNKV